VEIHGALTRLRHAVETRGPRITETDVGLFYWLLSEEPGFYFSNRETSEKLKEYFDTCFALAGCTRKLGRPDNSQAQIAEIRNEQDRLSQSEQLLFAQAKCRVEEELRSAVKPGSSVV
jgi:hypothetical protein